MPLALQWHVKLELELQYLQVQVVQLEVSELEELHKQLFHFKFFQLRLEVCQRSDVA